MKRGTFAPKYPPKPARDPAEFAGFEPKPRTPAPAATAGRMVLSLPKSQPWRSEAYRRAVAGLPCAHCGIEGYSQAAHADFGKGMGIKSGDDTCFPLCGPHPIRDGFGRMVIDPGCHHVIGSSGEHKRERKRELEAKYAEQTRKLLAQNCEANQR